MLHVGMEWTRGNCSRYQLATQAGSEIIAVGQSYPKETAAYPRSSDNSWG
jgi:hypothetical protein